MLVYGDHQELCEPAGRIAQIDRQLAGIGGMHRGLERHAKLAGVLVETGRLLQGVADADFGRCRYDRRTAATDALNRFLFELAHALRRSWDSGFDELGALPSMRVESSDGSEVVMNLAEGFAFYAVYAEAYIEAARRLRLVATPRVIGIRSIGTSLAAVVAAALDAPAPVTVRPFGNPYDRKIAVDAKLERELLEGDPHFVIVDEGPGQSGSSFGAVCNWLEDRGVPLNRIAILPSHSGAPGAEASEHSRSRWNRIQRQPADFGERLPSMLECWCSSVLGQTDSPLRDISAGEWRRLRHAREEDWPAVVPAWERRKFLATVGGRPVLLKFAGLGEHGERKLAIARALYSEGLVPESLGLVHGFIAECWLDDAVDLASGEKPISEVARYIAARARLLPATNGSGASMKTLLTMARRNISLELGEGAACRLDRWAPRLEVLERRTVRVSTDNKLDAHEWLRARDGALIKCDALDHHQAHDLIGCQSIEWDVAGAIAEFDLDQTETAEFVRHVEAAGSGIDPELLEFSRMAYLAFRLGQMRLGAAMAEEPAEQFRLRLRGDRYTAELQHLLESTGVATPRESLVG